MSTPPLRLAVPGVATVSARVVARVRIPPEQVFEIARALTQQLDQWEKETGRRPPTPPDEGAPGS